MSYIGNTFTTQAFTPAVDFFNGNGSTVAFTLSRPVASVAQVQAVISNVPQKPGDAFTVSGNTITFTSAPPSGTQNIYVYYTSPITQVIAPGQGTVGTTQIQDNAITTAKIAAGAVIPADLSTGAPTWDVNGNVGIGTGTPTARLEVVGAPSVAATIIRAGSNGVGGIIWRNASNTSVGYTTINSDNVEYRSTNDSTGAYLQKPGITFPATQFASADANTLDDYEEGTWTPRLYKNGVEITSPIATVGQYIKIGRQVWVTTYFYKSGGTSATGGSWTIQSLPFSTGSISYQALTAGYAAVNSSYFAGGALRWQVISSTSTAEFYIDGSIPSTNWTSGFVEFSFTGCYQSNS
jgi:hypothetical protein